MKNRKLIFILVIGTLLASLLGSNISNAILASDQLEVGATSFVRGELYLETAVAGDKLMSEIAIVADKIFTPSDIPDKLIEFEIKITPIEPYDIGFLDNPTEIRLTFLVFYDNRTTIMLAELFIANAADSIEITVLHEATYEGMTKLGNRKITFANGTSYLAADLDAADLEYQLIEEFTDMSDNYLAWHKYTILAISPTAVIGDDISYDPSLGLVTGTPPVITCEGDGYDAILVEYTSTGLFNPWEDAYQVEAYYEAASGLLIQIYEYVDNGIWKFIPCTLDTKRAPFPTATVILGITAIGLIAYLYRKKK